MGREAADSLCQHFSIATDAGIAHPETAEHEMSEFGVGILESLVARMLPHSGSTRLVSIQHEQLVSSCAS